MSSSNQTYNKINKATKTLRKATKITERREAAKELISLLANSNLRAKLKKDAIVRSTKINDFRTSDDNNATTATDVLRQIYQAVIHDAIDAANRTLDSKVKLKLEDVIPPLKIFRSIDSESDTLLASIKQSQNQNHYIPEPFTFESFDKFRDSNETLTFLSKKEIDKLLRYGLHCLHTKQICSIAEQESLNLLYKLCSRADYVSMFANSNDSICTILNELQPRIILRNTKDDDTQNPSPRNRQKIQYHHQVSMLASNAAKTFYNLIHNLVSLGIDIQIFVQLCIALVCDWIKQENSKELLQFMYGVIVDIFGCYPELCVGIIFRREDSSDDSDMDMDMETNDNSNDNDDGSSCYGKELFGYAKRSWSTARGIDRDALVGYFSAYL